MPQVSHRLERQPYCREFLSRHDLSVHVSRSSTLRRERSRKADLATDRRGQSRSIRHRSIDVQGQAGYDDAFQSQQGYSAIDTIHCAHKPYHNQPSSLGIHINDQHPYIEHRRIASSSFDQHVIRVHAEFQGVAHRQLERWCVTPLPFAFRLCGVFHAIVGRLTRVMLRRSGKSSLLLRFTDDDFLSEEETTATIGVDFRTKAVEVDGQRYKLSIWVSRMMRWTWPDV